LTCDGVRPPEQVATAGIGPTHAQTSGFPYNDRQVGPLWALRSP